MSKFELFVCLVFVGLHFFVVGCGIYFIFFQLPKLIDAKFEKLEKSVVNPKAKKLLSFCKKVWIFLKKAWGVILVIGKGVLFVIIILIDIFCGGEESDSSDGCQEYWIAYAKAEEMRQAGVSEYDINEYKGMHGIL